MKCRECARGKRFAEGSVYCILYGMIIREGHECERAGFLQRGRDEDHGPEDGDETGIRQDGGGDPGGVPGILPGSGEREGVPGVEGREGRKE